MSDQVPTRCLETASGSQPFLVPISRAPQPNTRPVHAPTSGGGGNPRQFLPRLLFVRAKAPANQTRFEQ